MCRTDQDLSGKWFLQLSQFLHRPSLRPHLLFPSCIGQNFTGDHILLVQSHVYRPPPLCSCLKTRQETAIGDEVRGNAVFSQRSKKLQRENPNFTWIQRRKIVQSKVFSCWIQLKSNDCSLAMEHLPSNYTATLHILICGLHVRGLLRIPYHNFRCGGSSYKIDPLATVNQLRVSPCCQVMRTYSKMSIFQF